MVAPLVRFMLAALLSFDDDSFGCAFHLHIVLVHARQFRTDFNVAVAFADFNRGRPSAGVAAPAVQAETAGKGAVHLLGEPAHHRKRTEEEWVARGIVVLPPGHAALFLPGALGAVLIGSLILDFCVCHEFPPMLLLSEGREADINSSQNATV